MLEQELNKYWKTVVNTIQDGVMIVDTDGTIVSENKAIENCGIATVDSGKKLRAESEAPMVQQ